MDGDTVVGGLVGGVVTAVGAWVKSHLSAKNALRETRRQKISEWREWIASLSQDGHRGNAVRDLSFVRSAEYLSLRAELDQDYRDELEKPGGTVIIVQDPGYLTRDQQKLADAVDAIEKRWRLR